jgi:hypothetical protein
MDKDEVLRIAHEPIEFIPKAMKIDEVREFTQSSPRHGWQAFFKNSAL